jgi:flagellar basal-body rod modification protein FlgD
MATISDATLASLNGTTAAAKADPTKSAAGSADQFLKLLVTQLKNQDPLNPMDNAQLTSQIAQINTVSGINQLNTTVQGLSSQFLQMQTLQGASLVGKGVVVPGNKLEFADGRAEGGFELTSAADAVQMDVLSPAGVVVDTVQLGAQSAGLHAFNWASGDYGNNSGLTFRITATSGTTKLDSTALMRDTVDAVSTSGKALQLELENSGTVDYSDVRAVN